MITNVPTTTAPPFSASPSSAPAGRGGRWLFLFMGLLLALLAFTCPSAGAGEGFTERDDLTGRLALFP